MVYRKRCKYVKPICFRTEYNKILTSEISRARDVVSDQKKMVEQEVEVLNVLVTRLEILMKINSSFNSKDISDESS